MLKIKFKKKVSLEESIRHNTLLSSKEFSKIRNILAGGLKDVASKSEVLNLVVDLYNNYLKDAPQREKDMLKGYLEKHGFSMEFSEDGKAIGGLDRIFALIRKKADFDWIADGIVGYFLKWERPPDLKKRQFENFRKDLEERFLEAGVVVEFYEDENDEMLDGIALPAGGLAVLFVTQSNVRDLRNQKHGKHKGYYANGVLRETGTFLNNERHGVFKTYYPDGKTVKMFEEWKEDMRHGKVVLYKEDGTIESSSNYEDDEEVMEPRRGDLNAEN